MENRTINVSELKPADYNPREISTSDLEELKKSIQQFGLVEGIVVNSDMTVIGGHQRLEAAKQLGIAEVPCIVLDLDKKQEKVLNLALNKISGYFNEEKLANVLAELESEAIGFSEAEISQALMRKEINLEQSEGYNVDDDEEIQKIFDRNEKVAVGVEQPGAPIRSDKVAFYLTNMEQWHKVKSHFATTRSGELDTNKLMNFVDSTEAKKEGE